MEMIPQNKGKGIEKIAPSKLVDGLYYYSTKFDGHYTQIVYNGTDVGFFTSGNKEFYIEDMADYIKKNFDEPFHIECEYTYGCEGKLGDRGKSAKLTTYRTNFSKGIKTKGNRSYDNFYVLDMLDMPEDEFATRLIRLKKLFDGHIWFQVPLQSMVTSLADAKYRAERDVLDGFEGGMLKSPYHIYQSGKRTNDIIKIKPPKTADLLCIGTTEGDGKYDGFIGSLVLTDSKGRTVYAGSGLSDYDREQDPEYYIDKVIEIGYEQILDTYIQPIYLGIRDDKDSEDID